MRIRTTSIGLVAALLTVTSAGAASREIDAGYGRDGLSQIARFGDEVFLSSAAAGPGDSVTASGHASGRSAGKWGTAIVTRFTATGALDRTFGTGGIARIPIARFQIWKLAVRSDKAVAVIGWKTSGSEDRGTERVETAAFMLTRTGEPDHRFGDHGYSIIREPSGDIDQFGAIAAAGFQPNGRLVVAMFGWYAAPVGLALSPTLLRLSLDGTPDKTFGRDGYGGATGSQAFPVIKTMQILSDGSILTGGRYQTPDNDEELYLARFGADGLADPTFGVLGFQSIASEPADMVGVRAEPDGSITAVSQHAGHFVSVARRAPNGTPISSYGKDGVARWGTPDVQIDDLAMTGPGRFVAATLRTPEFPRRWGEYLVSYSEKGPERSFGSRGSLAIGNIMYHARPVLTRRGVIVVGEVPVRGGNGLGAIRLT